MPVRPRRAPFSGLSLILLCWQLTSHRQVALVVATGLCPTVLSAYSQTLGCLRTDTPARALSPCHPVGNQAQEKRGGGLCSVETLQGRKGGSQGLTGLQAQAPQTAP